MVHEVHVLNTGKHVHSLLKQHMHIQIMIMIIIIIFRSL